MKRFSMMLIKRVMFVAILISLGGYFFSEVKAQSTVYIFMRSLGNFQSNIKLNGEKTFSLQGNLKKAIPVNNGKLLSVYSAVKKKFVLKNEGKYHFQYVGQFVNVNNGKTIDYTAEIQVNATEGSTHYYELVPRGIYDIQFKELKEKEGLKLLKKDKYQMLTDYIEE